MGRGERKAAQVFRLELSSSESDSDDGGRHKKDRKKDKCVETPREERESDLLTSCWSVSTISL
jgi:hypothetical protein